MVKINSLEFENVKRIKAVQLEPAKNGLTVIGGKNRQGKTSVLDSIAWALGGDRFKPSNPKREGSMVDPHLKITLDNGIVVERSGRNSSLKVVDPKGNKGGQQLLNSFVEQFALDLPKFMSQTSREKADTLLKIIGVGDKLFELENAEKSTYNQRTAIGRIADQKEKFAKEMPLYTGVPTEPVSASQLIQRQQEILARNGENERLRQQKYSVLAQRNTIEEKIALLENELKKYRAELRKKNEEVEIACKSAENLVDESTAELGNDIAQAEQINIKVRANLARQRAELEAEEYAGQYKALTQQIEDIRQAKIDLLKGADLPLEGLSVENGELLYKGYKWDNMSGAEQLIVSASIVRRLNPECGFVLLDKLEQMDNDTLESFGKWLEEQGLQAIATRVSTGDECMIIIEDGMAVAEEREQPHREWKAGAF